MSAKELVVVGGGPGGYVAAIRASQLGMKVTLLERAQLGGICLNWGCIPTKALLRSAEVMHLLQHANDYGLSASNVQLDISKVVERSRKVAAQLSGGIKHLMKKNKVTVIEGTAKLLGGGKLQVSKADGSQETLTSPNILLATGARARTLPGMEPDGELVWSYREAMVPKTMPKSVLVVGSGAIGSEFASFYRSMGAAVTLVEVMERILPVEDEEISAFVQKAFEKQGMRVLTKAKVQSLQKGAGQVTATLEVNGKAETIVAERVIMAVGIIGNTEQLGLENTKVKVERGHIVNDGYGATAEPGVYAIGDVCGPPWLAHKASHEAVVCVEKIAGLKPHAFSAHNLPGCTYCHPQVASVGLTEAKAKAAGHNVKVGKFPLIGNGKAIAMGDTNGLIKTVFDAKTGELLGAHMVGPEVTEMIQGYTIARQLEATETDLMHTIFPHPTISESMHEAVLDAYGRVIHM